MTLTRRAALAAPLALAATEVTAGTASAAPSAAPAFRYCLNTSTVRKPEGAWGKSRPIVELIDIARKAGYAAIEPWVSELDEYEKTGGTLADLGKRIADAGLVVPDAIGFAEWIVEDESRRKKGLEQAKRDMAKVKAVGGVRMAAPPVGATGGTSRRDDPKFTQPVDLVAAADRYRALFELGKEFGITPVAELWGASRTMSRLGEAILVAAEGGCAGCVLPDVYHLYKGGSAFAGLNLLGPGGIGIFHMNDYPNIARGTIVDQDRVYPGDGVAPLGEVFRTLTAIGYRGYVSLELFNASYWSQDPLGVAKAGLAKMKALAGG